MGPARPRSGGRGGRPGGGFRRRVALGVGLASCWLAAGCGGDRAADDPSARAPDGAIHVVDATGAELTLPRPAERIVSLVPSATATLRAMGASSALVARTDFDTAAWAADLPSVGGGLGPNLETLVSLEPDLVIRFAGSQDARTPARLDELGIAHVAVRPDRIGDIYETARILGAVTGLEWEAEALSRAIRAELHRIAVDASGSPPVRVAYVLGGTPPWVAGPDTYIDELIALVGGVNVFSDLDALYAAVSPEELLTRDIDVVLVPGAATYDTTLTPGARTVDVGSRLELPSPEVVGAARFLAEQLRGGAP